ncbi:DUF21 domain-containing protein [Alkalilacustris brevis]|uniref:DUF21 domain-containing protein n=1 Tax=Alkalilacustris brevis TaxID=2026338 RepID=UPI000E0CF555|nr:DUF21 domain-containing protein [Alkalilacustris brevis]
MTLMIWVGIAVCIVHSGMFSGLNLAFFSIGRLDLEVEARKGDPAARKVLALRKNSNFLLVTILWGNVAINVLLALLSGSVMAGLAAFLFSTVVITIFGEIIPQAWFSRHALRVASTLAPVIHFYQILLYPVAKPTALVLDWWLGREAMRYMPERNIKQMLTLHLQAPQSDISHVEGLGAINFLTLDDEPLAREGEVIDPQTILQLPFHDDKPIFPTIAADPQDPFLQRLNAASGKWMIIVDAADSPRLAFNTDAFLRAALFDGPAFDPLAQCHVPIVAKRDETRLDVVLERLCAGRRKGEDSAIPHDLILLWGEDRRVITGADLLGRLLRGVGGLRDGVVR